MITIVCWRIIKLFVATTSSRFNSEQLQFSK